MKNPFGRAARESAAEQEPSLSPKQLRDRDENERFMQQLYAGQRAEAAPEPEPPASPPPAAVPPSTAAAVELLDIARQLLEGREDVESRVVRVLVGRALELLPRDPVAR
jgi:hypothetical protein